MKAMKILEKQCFEISCNHWLFLQWMMICYASNALDKYNTCTTTNLVIVL